MTNIEQVGRHGDRFGIDSGFVDTRVKWRGPLLLGVWALAILWVLGLAISTKGMESDLLTRSDNALKGHEITGVGIKFAGRDATLTGVASDDLAQQARTLVRAVEGVRHVTNDFTDTQSAIGTQPQTIENSTQATSTTVLTTAEVQQEINTLLQTKVVEFESGSAILTGVGLNVVDEIAKNLATAPTSKVKIVGHTDSTGSTDLNQTLSETRAESVRDALVARGIDPSRLATAGYGGTQPISDNSTVAGRQRNRRIEFVLS